MASEAKPYELNHAQSPAYWQVDILWTILASGEQTGGSYSLIEELCPKDSGPPPHYHDQDEGFYIIEGEITFVADGKTIKGTWPAHSFQFRVERFIRFRVDSDTARILNSYAPAGFERTVRELAEPAPERVLPPKGRPMFADMQKDNGPVSRSRDAYCGMNPTRFIRALTRSSMSGRKRNNQPEFFAG